MEIYYEVVDTDFDLPFDRFELAEPLCTSNTLFKRTLLRSSAQRPPTRSCVVSLIVSAI